MYHTQDQRRNQTNAHPRPVLAQAEESRSGELPSPRRGLENREQWPLHPLAQASLSRLSEMDSRSKQRHVAQATIHVGSREQPLILSLGRVWLAWARLSGFSTVLAYTDSHINQISIFKHAQVLITTTNHLTPRNRTKTPQKSK